MIKITERKEVKFVKIEPGLHKKLKLRATEKDHYIQEELKEILEKELEVDDTNE